jgi:hypothetical protein
MANRPCGESRPSALREGIGHLRTALSPNAAVGRFGRLPPAVRLVVATLISLMLWVAILAALAVDSPLSDGANHGPEP